MNFTMEAEIVEEAGYNSALRGLSFNKKKTRVQMIEVSKKLCDKDGGHNKFLESIYVWIEVKAPRYWWQEADTYRISSKQSESTMHTLVKEIKEGLDISEFELGSITKEQLDKMNSAVWSEDSVEKLVLCKQLLPEGFLQKRMWCMNYKTLRNIILQRRTHRLPHWKSFIEQVLSQVKHPELLPTLEVPKV